MPQPDAMLDTIEAIYDAGTDPERWHDALRAIARIMDCPVGALGIAHREQFLTEIVSGADPGTINGMTDENLWYERRHLALPNKAITGDQLASANEVKRTRVYEEVLKPRGLLHMCAVAFVNKVDVFGTVTLLRSEGSGLFQSPEIDLLDALTPHISRAAKITSLLESTNLYAAGLEAGANELSFGLMLLDDHGRVLFANRAAERLFDIGRIKCRRDGRLTVPSGSSEESLNAFLDRLALLPEAAAVRIVDNGGRGLKLMGAPLPVRRRDFACLASVAHSVIFLFDEAEEVPSMIRLIAELYGLTPAELRLAEALLAGNSLAEYGEQAGLSRNTLKGQLRSLFDKTDTVRQSDLLRQLAKLTVVPADR